MIKLTSDNIMRIGISNRKFADHLQIRHMAKYNEYKSFYDFDHDTLFEHYKDALIDAKLEIQYEKPFPNGAPECTDFDLLDSNGNTLLSGGHFSSEGEALKSCLIWTFEKIDMFCYLADVHIKCWDKIRKNDKIKK